MRTWLAAWTVILVGLVLGGIAIGLISTPAAVVGYVAGILVVAGVFWLLSQGPEPQKNETAVE